MIRPYPKIRQAAYYAVSKAFKNGEIKRLPCEVCGTDKNVHGHHEDYLKPLDLKWLCCKHHIARHKELGWGYPERGKSEPQEYVIVSIRLSPEEREMVDRAAKILGVSRHKFMKDAILNSAKRIIRMN